MIMQYSIHIVKTKTNIDMTLTMKKTLAKDFAKHSNLSFQKGVAVVTAKQIKDEIPRY